MQESTANSVARERVLDAAERLFAQKGYNAVTLRDIAAEIGIRHTSLYHHVPAGKEQLFLEVTERSLRHHQDGLTSAIALAGNDIQTQLYAAADWLLSQPPMDLLRMVYSDMPSLNKANIDRLTILVYQSILAPLESALRVAQIRGQITHPNPGLIAGGLLGMIESLHSVPDFAVSKSRSAMAQELIDVMLTGLGYH